jgi:CRISPR-associated endonuclease/helicase Cas3
MLAPPADADEADAEPSPAPARLARELRRLLEDGEDHGPALEALFSAMTARPPADPLTAAVVRRLSETKPRAAAYPEGVVLSAWAPAGFSRREAAPAVGPAESGDDGADADDTLSLRAGALPPAAVGLQRHTEGVVRRARAAAERLGVGGDILAALTRAARLHDLGKADWRFQFVLYGDEPGEALLAKSGRDLDAHQREQVRRRSGLPHGFRHEFLSVALARCRRDDLLKDFTEGQRRLVEYLVGAHHGRGRPFVPVVEEPEGERVSLTWDGVRLTATANHGLWRLDARWADGFWELVRRFGWWGLAYLEALLRLADAACSAAEQRGETG